MLPSFAVTLPLAVLAQMIVWRLIPSMTFAVHRFEALVNGLPLFSITCNALVIALFTSTV